SAPTWPGQFGRLFTANRIDLGPFPEHVLRELAITELSNNVVFRFSRPVGRVAAWRIGTRLRRTDADSGARDPRRARRPRRARGRADRHGQDRGLRAAAVATTVRRACTRGPAPRPRADPHADARARGA